MSVQTTRIDNIAVVRLNRPDVLNALDLPMAEALLSALEAAKGDPLQGLVLTGAGGAFCSGANMKAMAETDERGFRRFIETIQRATRILRSLPFPTVAAIEKIAIGGGLELGIACDFRVAGHSTRFGFPEVDRGLVVTSAASRLLALTVGLPVARQLLFLLDHVDGEFAERVGLVDELCPDGEAEKHAVSLLSRLGSASGPAVAEMRLLLEAGFVGDLENVYQREIEASTRCFVRPDAAEGIQAFLERRPPCFQ